MHPITRVRPDRRVTAELREEPEGGSRKLDYVVDRVEKLVTIVGEYTDAAEWRSLLRRMLRDPRIQPGFTFLRDRRGAPTPADVHVIIGVMDAIGRFWPHLQPSRAAILVSRDCDPIRLAAYSLADGCGLSVATFTSYDEARRWLREGPAAALRHAGYNAGRLGVIPSHPEVSGVPANRGTQRRSARQRTAGAGSSSSQSPSPLLT